MNEMRKLIEAIDLESDPMANVAAIETIGKQIAQSILDHYGEDLRSVDDDEIDQLREDQLLDWLIDIRDEVDGILADYRQTRF